MFEQDPPGGREKAVKPVAVVGLVASTAAFRSLEQLFALMPVDSGAAFIIVSGSADPLDTAALIGVLNAHGGPPAHLAVDGERLEANRIAVAPIGMMTTLEDGHLRLAETEQAPGHRGTVDSFLISLAEQQGQAAVGIILAALQDAGSLGIARLKACGGLALAEAAPGQGEPEPSAIEGASGMADKRLPLAEIPNQLLTYVAHLRELDETAEAVTILRDGESRIPAIATVLRNRTGHDFHGYKVNTFLRRVQRRMHVLRIDDLDDYVERLRADPDEVQDLFQDLLIGVTQFFRDPSEFAALEARVLPELLRGKGAGDTLRIWVLGCSTGEEAYSLAMLIREATAQMDAPPHTQIFATDIDARALAVARSGRYQESIAKDVPPERLARWFVKEGATYCIHRDLREMCIFSAHNVIRDAPFSRVDLISCRNLLIYLNPELQDRVIPLFHFALRPGGHLFLGPSENVTRQAKLFQQIDRKNRIFRRLDTTARVLPEFPLGARADVPRLPGEAAVPLRAAAVPNLGKRAERVVERYAPAYVIVDEEHQVLNFSGRTGPFLNPISGAANLNLLNLVHRDLRLDLRAALLRAAADRRTVRVAPLRMGTNGEARRVGLSVEPLVDNPQDPPSFVVLFHDYGADLMQDVDPLHDPAVLRDEHVARLEGELRVTRDRLQATIEELESTNEELKSSNEEYQSVNEELQSANEELQTSKEELQSVNEELQTVNGELSHRISELGRSNSDLKNLLEATQIATLFLDNEFRVKSFTPGMTELFHLIEGDIGRPIGHIVARVPYPELDDDVRRVLRTLTTIEREIGASQGPHYQVRVLPYRSTDNFIAGTVLTFLDVTSATNAQRAQSAAEERARLATRAARIIVWELEVATGRFVHSEGFESTFGFAPPASLAALVAAAQAEDRDRLSLAFDGAIQAHEPLDVEVRLMGGRGEVWAHFSGARHDGKLMGVTQDVDERRRAAAQQSLLMAELQHRVKNILAVVRSLTSRSLQDAVSLEEFGAHFSGRIDALARTQSLLANRGAGGIRLDELVREELAASLGRESGQVVVEGPAILLKDKAAEAFTLAVHELTTNAIKHGALSRADASVTVRWRVTSNNGGGWLVLEWSENGVPLSDLPPARHGFGRKLIERGLPYDLGADTTLEFTPDGVRCTVELPLGPRVIALDEKGWSETSGDQGAGTDPAR
ncbi:CheR family methyltransferase [Muricoccus radiodurans]|uniref:CheR family methyltransferase n=1 Tax=Muricoccus radiodurans TaxID=2231721 RepID=UPI003CF72C1B